jgi:beta-aspartyl-dipeptidase (metallo-type)
MLKLIKNIEIYSPKFIGKKDVLIASDKIFRIEENVTIDASFDILEIDGSGKLLFPGFIDSHVHILGGGGEGGFKTRTPEIMLSDITKAGVTTVIGTLGTDGTTRTMASLLAKANALEEEGISTFINTGSYQIPVKALTNSITEDILLIDKIVGVGEIAIADHRSSHPTVNDLIKIASEARVGGMLSGKVGVVNIHMGDSKSMMSLIERVIEESDIPKKHFLPTHMNRNPYLFEKSIEYAIGGGFVDYTTSTVPLFIEEGEVAAYRTLKHLMDKGVDMSLVTFSSDGQGSLPIFDEKGEMRGIDIGKVSSLYEAVKDAVLKENIDIEIAISTITSNPAKIYGLKGKGKVLEGMDADLVIVSKEDMKIDKVIAKGKIMVDGEKIVIKGTFE